jgi:toxin ParE1/3/4
MPVYRLSAAAEEDIIHLLAYTHDRFGEIAHRRDEALLVAGLRDIASGVEGPGSVARPELGYAMHSYHLRHSGERARTMPRRVDRPRHPLLYRVAHPGLIRVGRVLYDGMEVERHLPGQFGDDGQMTALPGAAAHWRGCLGEP